MATPDPRETTTGAGETPRGSLPSPAELAALRRALRLARRGRHGTSPNPMVGCVVLADDRIVGEGWHRRVGGPHAEVEALRDAGAAARGATLCVTLEPCAHHGRTPPCADAVVAAGVRRVVACFSDPDSRVAGQGFARLAAAGIDLTSGHLAEEAVRLNWRYLVSRLQGRPAVTLKWAMSLDGRIATRTGASRWISGPESRRWALDLRELHDAVLVGSGTVLADDPRLTRRLGRARGPILRVVLDRRLRLGAGARLLAEPGPVVVYTQAVPGDGDGVEARARELETAGAEVVTLPVVDPASVLADLGRRGVASVLVEGGGEVHAAFVEAGVFERVEVAVAPLLVGGRGAPGPLGGIGADRLERALRLERPRLARRGEDLLLSAFRRDLIPELIAACSPG